KLELKKGWRLDPDFVELWSRIKHRTRYSVAFTTEAIINAAAERLKKMPAVEAPKIVAQRARIGLKTDGLESTVLSVRDATMEPSIDGMPDLVGYLQRETELTRETLGEIII